MTLYDAVKEVIHSRRSVRRFTEQPVAVEDVKELIDCARYAPSDTNSQTWEFIAVMNREQIRRIEQMTWDALHAKAAEAEERASPRKPACSSSRSALMPPPSPKRPS